MTVQRTTIHDVAAAAGVSVATVSKAVNGRYGVATATVARVMEAVEALGYESSLVASSMRSRRTGVIGVLVAGFEPFSTEILKGVGAELRMSEYDVLAYAGPYQVKGVGWERRSLQRLSGTLIDGAIMVTPTVVSASADVPIVAIDPHSGRADLPSVESDSYGGARQATQHLVELGHTRIGLIGGRADLRSATLREAGYRRALADGGIAFDPSLVREGQYLHLRQPALSLLEAPHRPTAVFAANDLSAIALLEVAAELGIDVPGELSVVGFDDIPEAARSSPPLTTIRQPIQQLGAAAARMVLELMAGQTPSSMHVVLGTNLVERDTTARR